MAEEWVHVLVEREGGFAGMKLDTELDTRELSDKDAQSVRDLVTKAEGGIAGLDVRSAGHPDMSTWDVTVRRGDRTWRASFDDGGIPPGLRPLLDLVLERGHTRGSGPARPSR